MADLKIRKCLAVICIAMCLNVQPVFAQTAQLSNSIEVLNEVKLNISADKSNSASIYTCDAEGNIRCKAADGSYYVNGVGTDGYIYDENGIRLNTVEYIGRKYYERVKNASEEELIKFDNKTDADLFMHWFVLNQCQEQGWVYHTINLKRGGTAIAKSEIAEHATKTDERALNSKVDEIVSSISSDASEVTKINAAQRLVEQCFSYDQEALYLDMNDAIKEKRGVCFHYTKLLHSVLDRLGIPNSIVYGTLDNTAHCWNQCYAADIRKNIMLDATNVSKSDAVTTYSSNPDYFFSIYNEATVEQ